MLHQNRQCLLDINNKAKLKPRATAHKSEIKTFNWVTLSITTWVLNIGTSFIICKDVQFCAFTKSKQLRISLTYKNLLVHTVKNKRNKEINNIDDAKFYQIKTSLSE